MYMIGCLVHALINGTVNREGGEHVVESTGKEEGERSYTTDSIVGQHICDLSLV